MKDKYDAFGEILNLIKVKEDKIKYPGEKFYFKDKTLYFEHNIRTGEFWVNEEKIWSVFKSKYFMNDKKIEAFIKEQVEEHFNLSHLMPMESSNIIFFPVEGYFNKV